MRPFTIQVYAAGRAFRAWTVYCRDLEAAKNEAELAVARDWPTREFSVIPGRGHR